MQNRPAGDDLGARRNGKCGMPGKRYARPALRRACLLACGSLLLVGAQGVRGVAVEAPVVPTVYPVLTPSSAIDAPLMLRGDQADVWRKGAEQRMYLSGRFVAQIGYRTLRSDQAAIFLTPSREGGEATYDVAIYLSGNARVEEGESRASTVTTNRELLVTTRVSGAIQLSGTTPRGQALEDNPVVKRGDALRMALLTKPVPPPVIPYIVITEAERALQEGWIARGPGNRIIAGPGEAVAAGGGGATAPAAVQPTKVRPQVFATGDRIERKKMGGEEVTIVRGSFVSDGVGGRRHAS